MSKALFYTQGEGQEMIRMPFEMTREEFEQGGFPLEDFESYSPALEINMTMKTFNIEGINVRNIFFDNGIVYECTRGYRHMFYGGYDYKIDAEYFNKLLNN